MPKNYLVTVKFYIKNENNPVAALAKSLSNPDAIVHTAVDVIEETQDEQMLPMPQEDSQQMP